MVLLDNIENSTLYHRLVAEGLMIEPVHGVQPSTDSPSDIVAKYFTNVSQCTILLPAHAEKKRKKMFSQLVSSNILEVIDYLFCRSRFAP